MITTPTLASRRLALALLVGALFGHASAQSSATGVIEGRVRDAGTNNFIQNVRIVIDDSTLETVTNAAGEYRLANAPAGTVSLTAHLPNFASQTRAVTVAAGATVRQDYDLRGVSTDADNQGGVLHLDTFTVSGRVMGAASAALADQHNSGILKNVVAFEEFGDISGDGNPGEFLKYVPGVNMNYGPDIAQFASVRGVPPNGTLVMLDGALIGSSTGDRQFEITGASTGNIDRIEITKTPTPDMAANSIGGAINIVGKSGFSRDRPLYSYALYENFNIMNGRPGLQPHLGKRPSPDANRTTASTVQPGFDLSAIVPVNKTFAFTLSAGASNRYHNYDVANTTWDLVNKYLTAFVKQDAIILSNRTLLAGSADWRPAPNDTVHVSLNRSRENFHVAQSGLNFGFGTGGTGSADFTQSRTGGGTVAQAFTNDNSYRDTQVYTTRYTHDGHDWRFDASLSYTSGNRRTTDVADGTFSGLTASYSALNLRADGIAVATDGGLPRITATNAAGTAVNVFDGGGLPITAAAGATGRDNHDTISSAKADLERTFSFRIPLKLKAGLARTSERLDLNASPQAWTVAIPGAPANTARNLGLTADAYSNVLQWYDIDGQRAPVTLISAASLYALYKAHPEYFTLNEAAAYMGVVNNSKAMRETISAGYIMGDTKLFNNRLRLVGGVRYEKTDDAGLGPKNDVSATYVRDANGNIVRSSTGAPVKITTDALGLAKLQYTLRAAKTDRSYDGFYPSMNAIYHVTDKVLVRFGYAQTIARPAMSQILPGVTLPDPTGTSRTITLNNTGLRPWSARNYDLSVEAYEVRDATLSVGVFRKDLQDFFTSTTAPVTADTLEEFGLGNEFNGYDLVTMRNGGSASLTGLEWSYRQNLRFLPKWARGFQIFANGTSLHLSGPNAADFTQFSPVSVNWGIGLVRPRFLVKVNVNHSGRIRTTAIAASATIPAGTYFYIAPQDLVDVSAEYRFTRWLSVYGAVRNLTQSAKFTRAQGPDTPDYAQNRVTQRFGALFTMGVKGQF